jgi:hypothetical protein
MLPAFREAAMATEAARRRAHVVLPQDVMNEIDEVVGPRGRSRFIEEAVVRELRRRRLRAALAAMDGALADVEIPGWETPEATSAWVRALRGHDADPPAS